MRRGCLECEVPCRAHYVLAQSSVITTGIELYRTQQLKGWEKTNPVLSLCVLPSEAQSQAQSPGLLSAVSALSQSLPLCLRSLVSLQQAFQTPSHLSLTAYPFSPSVLISYHFFSSHQGLGCQGLAVHKDVGKAGDGGILEHSFCTV